MLVLSRKSREQIQIGENVTVTVLQIKGSSVRLGIDAPREVRVVRGELPAEPAKREPQRIAELTVMIDESTQQGVGGHRELNVKDFDPRQTTPVEGPGAGPGEEEGERPAMNRLREIVAAVTHLAPPASSPSHC